MNDPTIENQIATKEKRIKREKKFFLISLILLSVSISALYINRSQSYSFYQRLEFKATTGSTLWANLYYPSKELDFQEKHPLIIWTHGLGGQRDLDLRIPIEFTKRGFFVACLDYQGHGESQGDIFDIDKNTGIPAIAQDISQLLSKIELLDVYSKKIDPNQIGLIGHSLGGCVTLMNYALDSRFKAAVTWAALVNFDARDLGIADYEDFNKYVPVNLVNSTNTQNLLAIQHVHDEVLDYQKNAVKLHELTGCKLLPITEPLPFSNHVLISSTVMEKTINWFESHFFGSETKNGDIIITYVWNYILLFISLTLLIITALFLILICSNYFQFEKVKLFAKKEELHKNIKSKKVLVLETIIYSGGFMLIFWIFSLFFGIFGLIFGSVFFLSGFVLFKLIKFLKEPKIEREEDYLRIRAKHQLHPKKLLFTLLATGIILSFYLAFSISYPFAFFFPSNPIYVLVAYAVYPFYFAMEIFYRRILYPHFSFMKSPERISEVKIITICINQSILMLIYWNFFVTQSLLVSFLIMLMVLIVNTIIYQKTEITSSVLLSSFIIIQIFFGVAISNVLNLHASQLILAATL